MKKLLTLTLLSTSLLIACNQDKHNLELDKTLTAEQEQIITLGGHNVYKNEFSSYVNSRKQLKLEQLSPQAQQGLFDEFVQLELLSRKAVTSGLNKTDEFAIQSHNMQKNLLAQALLEKFAKDNPVTDIDIQAQYEIAKAEFEIPQLKVKHILVNTQEEAQAIIDALNKPQTIFSELAKERSIGPSGPNGGDLSWFYPGQMYPEFSAAAIELEKGSFSQVPVATKEGYHVILKEDERIGSAPPIENLRPRLEQKVKQNRLEKYIQEIRLELNVKESFQATK